MPKHDGHVKTLDKKITDLSDALANLGKGTDLKELLKIIRHPGFTTPAELALMTSMVDTAQELARALNNINSHLLVSSRLVETKVHESQM